MPTPLTGAQYEISAGDYTAVVTELGAGLRALHHRGAPLLAGYEPDEMPPAGVGQLLLPWPNRVDHGRYSFCGAELQLDLSEPANGNAIHGLTRWASWSPVTVEPDRVLLRQALLGHAGYPFCLDIDAEYRVDARTGLEVRVTALNHGSRRAPYGTGSHPYLTAGTATVDECELRLPAGRWQPADDRGIPHGEPEDVGGSAYDFRAARRLEGASLDHAFTELGRDSDGLARVLMAGPERGVQLWAGEGYRWLQVFTGDALGPDRRRRALAVEPMTCPPNAFVTGTDLLVIEPGESVWHTWGITALAG